jgi:hypothetical protein
LDYYYDPKKKRFMSLSEIFDDIIAENPSLFEALAKDDPSLLTSTEKL